MPPSRHRLATSLLLLLVALVPTQLRAQTADTAPSPAFVPAPPLAGGPVEVEVDFVLDDITEIDDSNETFAFSGTLGMRWRDPRQAFDPVAEGVDEKVYTGPYQVDELAPGWFPQLVLVNDSGELAVSGTVLRVRPDGSSTLLQAISAVAEGTFEMRRYPYDSQRLIARFAVLGHGSDELRLRAGAANRSTGTVQIPQWDFTGMRAYAEEREVLLANGPGPSSTFVLEMDVKRQSFYIRRLIVFPLVVIVLLSFSVFWMDRSSIGDRLSVSFIGILAGVAYQVFISEQMPRVSYFTVMNAFLNLSFLVMCATVLASLVVAAADKRGNFALGDRLDRISRWAFPGTFFALLGVMGAVELLLD